MRGCQDHHGFCRAHEQWLQQSAREVRVTAMASHDTSGRRDPYFAGHYSSPSSFLLVLLLLLLLPPITGEQRRARGWVGRLGSLKSTQSLTLRADNEWGCARWRPAGGDGRSGRPSMQGFPGSLPGSSPPQVRCQFHPKAHQRRADAER